MSEQNLRTMHGHPLRVLRTQYDLSIRELAEEVQISGATISRAENGHMINADSRRRLARFFGKTSRELGLLGWDQPDDREEIDTRSNTEIATHPIQMSVPTVIVTQHQFIDALIENAQTGTENQLGAWLTLEASQLGQLLNVGWSVESILTTLQTLLHSIQGLPHITRRTLLALGSAAAIAGIELPTNSSVSEEERIRLCETLGTSLTSSWNLFHTSSIPQVFAVGQAQLYMVQQAHSYLYPNVRPLFHSAAHRLLGATLYFMGNYVEAKKALEKAYIAGLEYGSIWEVAQNLSWQAYIYEAIGDIPQTIQTIDAALRLLVQAQDMESTRLRARLYALSAECAAQLQNAEEAQKRLSMAETFLPHISTPHEEFDNLSWKQYSGTAALYLGQHKNAIEYLEPALHQLPFSWRLRYVMTTIPLAKALVHTGQIDHAVEIMHKALSAVHLVQSHVCTDKFVECLRTDVIPNVSKVHKAFIADVYKQLPQFTLE